MNSPFSLSTISNCGHVRVNTMRKQMPIKLGDLITEQLEESSVLERLAIPLQLLAYSICRGLQCSRAISISSNIKGNYYSILFLGLVCFKFKDICEINVRVHSLF